MVFLSIPFAGFILILTLLNFIGVSILRGEDRFWLPPIILWLLLFFALVVVHQFYSNDLQMQKSIFEAGAGRDAYTDLQHQLALQQTEKESSALFRLMVHLLGTQSVLAALSQLAGYQSTGKKYYRSALLTFLSLAFFYLVVALLFLK